MRRRHFPEAATALAAAGAARRIHAQTMPDRTKERRGVGEGW